MPLAEEQFQIRGLVLGPGTTFPLLPGTNPFDRATRAEQSGPRAWNHGSWSGVEWMDEAVLRFNILVDKADTATWVQGRNELAAAFRPIGENVEDVELRFALGGSEYLMRGRPRGLEHDVTLIRSGRSISQAGFVAQDPFIYSGAEVVTGPISLPSFTGGLTVPLTVPFTVDGVLVGGQEPISNTGTADTSMLWRIDGPVPEPRVTLEQADGQVFTLRFNLELQAGQWLDVDTGARTVTLNGQASRRGQAVGDFPLLPPGTHTLHFRAADDAAGTLTSRHRHAFW